MTELWYLFLRASFVENMPLSLFLGLCTFLALSKRPETALGLETNLAAAVPSPPMYPLQTYVRGQSNDGATSVESPALIARICSGDMFLNALISFALST